MYGIIYNLLILEKIKKYVLTSLSSICYAGDTALSFEPPISIPIIGPSTDGNDNIDQREIAHNILQRLKKQNRCTGSICKYMQEYNAEYEENAGYSSLSET